MREGLFIIFLGQWYTIGRIAYASFQCGWPFAFTVGPFADLSSGICRYATWYTYTHTHKSSGLHDIPPTVLGVSASELALPLTLSYLLGLIPKSYKIALVYPIPEKVDHSNPSNCQPIAITSLFFNILYLEVHQLISNHQYDFRYGRSTSSISDASLDKQFNPSGKHWQSV